MYISVNSTYQFSGHAIAYGSVGTKPGRPGMVYVVSTVGQSLFRKLTLDGSRMNIDSIWHYGEIWNRGVELELEELTVQNQAYIALRNVSSPDY